MTNAEDAWKTLAQVNDWIKVADTKAGAVLSACGVLGGAVLHGMPPQQQWAHQPWTVGLLFTSLALAAASALMAMRVFAPRLKAAEPTSLLYFDHIARGYARPERFSQDFIEMLDSDNHLRESLADQVWATSTVARRKFRHVTPAVWLFGISLLVAGGAGLVHA